jgi:RNA-binding protein
MSSEAIAPVLSGAQRRTLRRHAHPLRPSVALGAAGLTDGVVDAIDRALEDHELIKLKLAGERGERAELATRAAERTGSALAGTVGRVAILYRPARDAERRRIDPSARDAGRQGIDPSARDAGRQGSDPSARDTKRRGSDPSGRGA